VMLRSEDEIKLATFITEGKERTMRFFKVGDQYINVDNIASIAESSRGYVLYWTDHNGKGKQTDFTKDSNEGKALAQFIQSN
jgi:hypothetical protein